MAGDSIANSVPCLVPPPTRSCALMAQATLLRAEVGGSLSMVVQVLERERERECVCVCVHTRVHTSRCV